MVQLYHKKTINIDRKTPNIKTKKGVESSDFHTFSYGYLLLFIVTYLTSSKSASCTLSLFLLLEP